MSQILNNAKKFFVAYCARMILFGSLIVGVMQLFTVSEVGITRAITISVGFFVIITVAALILSLFVGFLDYFEK